MRCSPWLARACMGPRELGEAVNLPLHEALRKQAQQLAVDRVIESQRCELERQLTLIAEQPELSPDARRMLWSQVVAVQRRLDIYVLRACVVSGLGPDLGPAE